MAAFETALEPGGNWAEALGLGDVVADGELAMGLPAQAIVAIENSKAERDWDVMLANTTANTLPRPWQSRQGRPNCGSPRTEKSHFRISAPPS